MSTLPRYQAAIDARARAEADSRLPGQPAQVAPAAAAGARDRIMEILKSLTEERRVRRTAPARARPAALVFLERSGT